MADQTLISLVLNDKDDSQYIFLEYVNKGSFYVSNAVALLIIIVMVYRIRHVVDETLIKKECAIIVLAWMFCST